MRKSDNIQKLLQWGESSVENSIHIEDRIDSWEKGRGMVGGKGRETIS